MDSAPVLLFDLGWVFFAGWSTVIVAVSLIAFKADLAELMRSL